MILHAIELTHVGVFRGSVSAGEFARGVNVIAAPNEAGKSTLLRAAARALFARHNSRNEKIRALQPAGTQLAPRVAVEFSAADGQRYRVEKTFLQTPSSRLSRWENDRWQPLADADRADTRVWELLQASLSAGGGAKAEHWGLFGFLWARQDAAAEWPRWDEVDQDRTVRPRLARVELDPLIEKLRGLLEQRAAENFTPTGKIKEQSALSVSEKELAQLDKNLAGLQRQREQIEEAQHRFNALTAEAAQLEKELEARRETSLALTAQAAGAEKLRDELKRLEASLSAAREQLDGVSGDAEKTRRWQSELAEARQQMSAAGETVSRERQRLAALAAKIDGQQRECSAAAAKLEELRGQQQRAQNLLQLRRLRESASASESRLDKVSKAQQQLAALTARRDALPPLTPQKISKLENLTNNIRDLKTRALALGLSVRLQPERDAAVTVSGGQRLIAGGAEEVFHSPQTLRLQLAGWGAVTVQSGAGEVLSASGDLAREEKALRDLLLELRAASLEQAREFLQARRELDGDIKNAQTTLADLLGERGTVDELRAAAAAELQRADLLAGQLAVADEERALTASELESREAALAVAVKNLSGEATAADRQLAGLRNEEQAARRQSSAAADHHHALTVTQTALQTRLAELAARYPSGLEPSLSAARRAFVEAEARVDAAREKLPADHDQLPSRSKRAAVALQQITDDLQHRRDGRAAADGELRALGGLGLHTRETELAERREELRARRDELGAGGRAARLCRDLIEFRQQAATRAVLRPLEDRLSATLSALTADTGRRVFLTEQLEVAGLGKTRGEVHAFEHLSQGAKEQLLLCLRLAVAQELAAGGEPQVLVLDDVLVNTDPARQERVLDLLQTAAQNLQIIILTCHPDRWRGAGRLVEMRTAR